MCIYITKIPCRASGGIGRMFGADHHSRCRFIGIRLFQVRSYCSFTAMPSFLLQFYDYTIIRAAVLQLCHHSYCSFTAIPSSALQFYRYRTHCCRHTAIPGAFLLQFYNYAIILTAVLRLYHHPHCRFIDIRIFQVRSYCSFTAMPLFLLQLYGYTIILAAVL